MTYKTIRVIGRDATGTITNIFEFDPVRNGRLTVRQVKKWAYKSGAVSIAVEKFKEVIQR